MFQLSHMLLSAATQVVKSEYSPVIVFGQQANQSTFASSSINQSLGLFIAQNWILITILSIILIFAWHYSHTLLSKKVKR